MKDSDIVILIFYVVFMAVAFIPMQNAAVTYANTSTSVGQLIYHAPLIVLVVGIVLPIVYAYREAL